MSPDARAPAPGITNMTFSRNELVSAYSPKQAISSVLNGRDLLAVLTPIVPFTSALDVVPNPMVPSIALEQRTRYPSTPYKVDAWEQALHNANIFLCFIDIPTGLRNGFLVDFPSLSHTQAPPNKDSVLMYIEEFRKILNHELSKGRYIGPFSESQLSSLIGHFQTSPISIIPKPGRPGKFRLVQNFSFPISPSSRLSNHSINSFIDSQNFPATWGKFSIVYLLISRLPLGSEATMRDIVEAYRTIPLHPS